MREKRTTELSLKNGGPRLKTLNLVRAKTLLVSKLLEEQAASPICWCRRRVRGLDAHIEMHKALY